MRKSHLIAVIGLSFAVLSLMTNANGQSFNVTYDFASVTTTSGLTDPTPVPTAAGVTFGSFSSVGLSPNPNASVRFSYTNNALGGINAVDTFSSFTGALDSSKYFSVTVTPLGGYSLNLDSIAFTIQRSGTGIRNYAVRSSLDGYSANLSASISLVNANLSVDGANNFQWVSDSVSTAQNGSFVTLGSSYDALTSPVTFRFYGWNAEGTGGTFSIDNVNLIGSVAAVPEPGTMALAAIGGLAGLWALRRKH